MTQEEIDSMLNSGADAGSENSSLETQELAVAVDSPEFPELQQSRLGNTLPTSVFDPKLELLFDLQMPVSIELGRTNMLIRDILRLGRGSVIEFDKLVSEPVDVMVNGKKVAEGEVVVIDKHFGIRITSLVDPADRLRGIKK